ncbi:MAG: NUDIX hydrolase N-terminal domain-containing protein [Actinomycetota bacterium]
MTGSGSEPVTPQQLRSWAESLAAVARTGLAFTESLYEQERFDEVLKVAAEMRASVDARYDADDLVQEWLRSVGDGVEGYVTPKVTVGAVVGNDDGEILLVQRSDSGVWLFPTGWADVGYSAAEVAVKEVFEETGVECVPVGVLSVVDGMRLGFTTIPLYSIVFHCHAVGGSLAAHPLETEDVGWFAEEALPEPLVGFERWGEQAFAAIRGEDPAVTWDPPRFRAGEAPPDASGGAEHPGG